MNLCEAASGQSLSYRDSPMVVPGTLDINAGRSPFDRLYGLQLLECSERRVLAEVAVREELTQPAGVIHGGVYASMAEAMASMATALAVHEEGLTAMGQANSTSFLRPVSEGTVHARGERIHRGRTTWVWDVRFTDDHDRLCAITRMTIAVRPPGQRPGQLPPRQAPAA